VLTYDPETETIRDESGDAVAAMYPDANMTLGPKLAAGPVAIKLLRRLIQPAEGFSDHGVKTMCGPYADGILQARTLLAKIDVGGTNADL